MSQVSKTRSLALMIQPYKVVSAAALIFGKHLMLDRDKMRTVTGPSAVNQSGSACCYSFSLM